MGYGKGTEGGEGVGSVSTPFENPSNFSATRLHVWMCVQCAVYDCRHCIHSLLLGCYTGRVLHTTARVNHRSGVCLSVCLSVRNPGLSPRSSSSATYSSDVDQEPVASVRFGFPVRGPTHWFLCRLPASFCHGSIGAITDDASWLRVRCVRL